IPVARRRLRRTLPAAPVYHGAGLGSSDVAVSCRRACLLWPRAGQDQMGPPENRGRINSARTENSSGMRGRGLAAMTHRKFGGPAREGSIQSQPTTNIRSPILSSGVRASETYEKIKELILANQLRPGIKLGHHELAERFKVSRTPVREALERLNQEGYVRHHVGRGYFVAEIGLPQTRE